MKDRKIMIEVTPEEYEKIVNGSLDTSSSLSNDELMSELIKRSSNKKTTTAENFYSWEGQFKVLTGALKINNDTTIEYVIKTRSIIHEKN